MKSRPILKLALFLLGVFCVPYISKAQSLNYGTRYHIKNIYGGGTYLDSCGNVTCSGTTKNGVSTNRLPDRDGGKTGIWYLESTDEKIGQVQYGDRVYIRNGFGNYFLDTCNEAAGCSSTGVYDVSTTTTRNRDRGSGIWIVESATGKTGDVQIGDRCFIKNKFMGGSYLDTCGGATKCSPTGAYDVSTNTSPRRDGSGTGTWTFENSDDTYPAYHERIAMGRRVVFKCKRSLLVRVDGCSLPSGLELATVPEFVPACNQHDLNYSTPWILAGIPEGKVLSDLQFQKDMRDIAGSDLILLGTAQAYYNSVTVGGLSSYDGGQEWATANCVIIKK